MITLEQVKKCDPDGVFDNYEIHNNDIHLHTSDDNTFIVFQRGEIQGSRIILSDEFDVISKVRSLIMGEKI